MGFEQSLVFELRGEEPESAVRFGSEFCQPVFSQRGSVGRCRPVMVRFGSAGLGSVQPAAE